MAFPAIYADETPPIDGYEGFVFRVLVNPTGATKDDWAFGNLGDDNCEACAKLNGPARGRPREGDEAAPARKRCERCTTARDRFGRAAIAIYGSSHVDGFDWSTTDAALASLSNPELPDELLMWLYMLPASLWSKRADELKKRLSTSLSATNGAS